MAAGRSAEATGSAGSPARCRWVGHDPLMIRYHDEEWGVPVHDGRALWEALILEGFQAGLSWRTILNKRAAFRAAFRGFDPALVARFDAADVERLMADPGIVRSRAKVEAAIGNARAFLAIERAEGGFAALVWGLAGGAPVAGGGSPVSTDPRSERLARELKRRGFKFVGPSIVHAWRQAVGMIDDHEPTCFRHAARYASAAPGR